MKDVLCDLFKLISERKENKLEGSYTCYLFEKGIDKILKKCGEECSEMIIAAKNNDKTEIVNEAADLIYHILIMLSERGVTLDEVTAELENRAKKQKNLKPVTQSDKNS